jgi:uncharacterized protein (TIGR02996 family)
MSVAPDQLALLRAVAAAPEDDTPKLVYADWLDEFGRSDADAARVEWIRTYCHGRLKKRFRKGEGEWLGSNWKRLWPRLADVISRRFGRTNFWRPIV